MELEWNEQRKQKIHHGLIIICLIFPYCFRLFLLSTPTLILEKRRFDHLRRRGRREGPSTIMKAGLTHQLRRVPTPIALAVGILFGFLFGRLLPWTTVSNCTIGIQGLRRTLRPTVPIAAMTTSSFSFFLTCLRTKHSLYIGLYLVDNTHLAKWAYTLKGTPADSTAYPTTDT